MLAMTQVPRSRVGLCRQARLQLEYMSIKTSFWDAWLLGTWPGNSQLCKPFINQELCIVISGTVTLHSRVLCLQMLTWHEPCCPLEGDAKWSG